MNSNEIASKISIGTAQFGLNYGISNTYGQTPRSEVTKILDVAAERGISMLDTASNYGISENVLGDVGIGGWSVVSKFPAVETVESLNEILELSLTRLRLNKIFAYLSHEPRALLDRPHIWEALSDKKDSGQITKVGFSIYTTQELEAILQLSTKPDLIQLPFSFLDQRFKPYLSELKESGIEIHTRSAFLQGLIFKRTDSLSDFYGPVKPIIQSLQERFTDRRRLAAFLLNVCLKIKEIDKVIIGINNAQQLEENLSQTSLFWETDALTEIPTIVLSEEILLPYNWPQE